MLTNGRATIKPAVEGFLNDNQLAKEIIKLANITFKKKTTMNTQNYNTLYSDETASSGCALISMLKSCFT